jgi:alkylmercury lyase
MSAHLALDQFTDELVGVLPKHTETQQRIGVTVMRRLVEGGPVAASAIADDLALTESEVADTLEQMPGVHFDDDERVIGYFGLTILEMGEHRLHIDGREVSTWCAWDTLFIPEMLGRTVEVTSRSPGDGHPISLRVGPEGPRDISPPDAVVSFVPITSDFVQNTIERFCHYVHFFPSTDAAEDWTKEHQGGFVLPVEDAYRLAGVLTHTAFGDVIPARPQ